MFFVWFAIHTCTAQMHESAFGEVHFFPIPNQYDKCTLISSLSQSTMTLAAWSGEQREILLATFDSTLSSVTYSLKHTVTQFDDIYAADIDGNGTPDLILVNKRDKSISCILDITTDSLYVTSTIRLSFEPMQVLIGDYNNDKRMDILVYDRRTPGIFPLIGNGKGQFTPGKVIVPDNVVGAASFAHLNDDNLIDLIIWDWVKSELHMLYGVGRGRFIDQSVFPVQGEVNALVARPMIRDHLLDLLLLMQKPSEFQLWEGNDFGDYQLKSHIALEGNVANFDVADINNNGLNDIVISLHPAALQVIFNNDVDAFSDRIEYASGDDPKTVVLSPPDGKGFRNCILFDSKGKQFIVYLNAMKAGLMDDSVQLVTGVHPGEIVASDFNRDSIPDIALVNSESRSVSLYWGWKASSPLGPFSYPLSGVPGHLAFHSSNDTTLHLVLSFPQTRQISYFTLDAANHSITNAFMTSEGYAQVITTDLDSAGHAEFVSLNTTTPSEGSSLSFFEQLAPTTFIERTFRLPPPDYLLGASVADLNQDKFPDIIYAYRAGDTSIVEVGVAFGDSSYSMKRRIISRELALPDVKQMFIWFADFDKDTVLDLLMYAGQPVEYFLVAKGKGEGVFLDPKIIGSGLVIEDRTDVQIVDVDGDSNLDIVVGSQRLGCVKWFRGLGDFNFATEQPLVTEDGISHYVVADFNADGINDLAMTFWKKGIVKIINGKQLPFRQKTKNPTR